MCTYVHVALHILGMFSCYSFDAVEEVSRVQQSNNTKGSPGKTEGLQELPELHGLWVYLKQLCQTGATVSLKYNL